jgi:hypothetical protein
LRGNRLASTDDIARLKPRHDVDAPDACPAIDMVGKTTGDHGDRRALSPALGKGIRLSDRDSSPLDTDLGVQQAADAATGFNS